MEFMSLEEAERIQMLSLPAPVVFLVCLVGCQECRALSAVA